MMQENEFSSNIRVYIEDTDAGGVVYYVNYLKFMERARTDYLREIGFPKPALLTDKLLMVVTSANIDYKKSARLDDLLSVTASVVKVARTYIVFEQNVWRCSESSESQELLAQGTIKVACVNRLKMKPAAFPTELQQAFKI